MAKSVYYLGQLSMEEDADPCGSGCKGVVCSKTHSVTNLHLSSANLSWGIPTAIGGLQELISVDLLENPKLTSTIPRQIGQLRRLTHLKLSGCNFHGKVPEEIYNLNNLEYLDLSNNPQLLQCENAQDLITLPLPCSLLRSQCLVRDRMFAFAEDSSCFVQPAAAIPHCQPSSITPPSHSATG
ncbi:uncharacterized protein [Physcomitrium patens]|uniref:uncharacterized protein isoform X3 n=1 Tax=Physcomitrium patens TaxID=3218 RepID=UPI000D178D8B|nr:probable leucine-rich repeat receptor-like protein kinase At5g49770 isoform X3 [Physcomitrium patens]|eukprot:XP_024387909.1 probable leucine-rich repeat receptor-like protein kinase At5g49770 isoform X3 [Physcomitrella patens]